MTELGKIKGVAFGEFLGWYAKHHDRATVEQAIGRVEPRYEEGLDSGTVNFGVLASHWYPAGLVHELVDKLTVGRSNKELDEMARDAAAFIMGRTLKGVYRAIFSLVATPERYIRYGNKLWETHYDSGKVVFRVPEPGVQYATFVDWASHHPFICRMNMASSVPIFEAMGCVNVRYERRRCISNGAADCENLIRWEVPGKVKRP